MVEAEVIVMSVGVADGSCCVGSMSEEEVVAETDGRNDGELDGNSSPPPPPPPPIRTLRGGGLAGATLTFTYNSCADPTVYKCGGGGGGGGGAGTYADDCGDIVIGGVGGMGGIVSLLLVAPFGVRGKKCIECDDGADVGGTGCCSDEV